MKSMSVSPKTKKHKVSLLISTCLIIFMVSMINSIYVSAASAGVERFKALQTAFTSTTSCNLAGNNDGKYKNIKYTITTTGEDGKYTTKDVIGSFGEWGSASTGGGGTPSAPTNQTKRPDQRKVNISDANGKQMNCLSVLAEMSNLAKEVANHNNSNPSDIVAVTIATGGNAPATGGDAGAATGGEDPCTKNLSGIGWWLCSPLHTAISFADNMWGILEKFLVTNPIEEAGPIRKTWEALRNLANALLVIIFLAVIFAQISNIGISNYGIKKILPRLVIMAILVNLSFFIVQISVDFANFLGSTADKFMTSMISADDLSAFSWEKALADLIVPAAGAVVAGGTAIAIAGIPSSLIFLALLIVPAIIGFIAALIALFIRNALVPIIAILAPLAFVAYILPNTQSLFDKWKKVFFSILFLYPVASIYFGALKFGASLVLLTDSSGLNKIVALAALYIGVGFIAVLVIKSNSIMGKMTGAIAGAANKMFSPVGKIGKGLAGSLSQNRMAKFKTQEKPSGFNKLNPVARAAYGYRKMDEAKRKRSLNASIYEAKATEDFNEKLRSNPDSMLDENLKDTNAYQGVISKLNEQDIDNAGKRLEGRDFGSIKSQALNNSVSKADRMAAIRYVLATGSITDYLDLAKNSGNYSSEGNKQERSEIQAAFYKKGIQGVLGSNIGAKILDGNINSDEDINAAVAQTMRDKNINSEALALDAGLTERVANVASGQASFNPGQEPPRDLVTNEGRRFNEGVAEIAKRAKDVKESEHLRTKLKGNAPESIDRIISLKPNGSVAGQVTSPNTSPTNNQTTPPPSNSTPPSPPSTPPRKTP